MIFPLNISKFKMGGSMMELHVFYLVKLFESLI